MIQKARPPDRQGHPATRAAGQFHQLGRWIAPAVLAILIVTVMETAQLQAPANAKARVTFANNAQSLMVKQTLVTAATGRDSCPEAGYNPVATAVEVKAVPIVVDSTTEEYFVLYMGHEADAGTTLEIPISVVLGKDGSTTLTRHLAAPPKERYRVEKYLVTDPADVDGDCIDDMTELRNLGSMSPVNSAASIPVLDGAVTIRNQEAFYSYAWNLERVKFTIYDLDTDLPRLYFQNSRRFTEHRDFQEAVSEDTSATFGKVAGSVIYDPGRMLSDGTIADYYILWKPDSLTNWPKLSGPRIHALLVANMPFLRHNPPMHIRAAYIQFIQPKLREYEDNQIPLLFDRDVFGDSSYTALNRGESYGKLRVMSEDDLPGPQDIVIYNTLPNDVPRVGGIITTVPQTQLSHANLRAIQEGIPNAFILDALTDVEIEPLIGSYVRLEVGKGRWVVTEATLEEVESHHNSIQESTAQTLQRDLSETEITPLNEIGFADSDRFGVKAANVAELLKLDFPAGTVPDGFAVPFHFYDEFMKHNDLYDDIEKMLADAEFQADTETQARELKKLRKTIKKAETPGWIETALTEMHSTYPEAASLRYRSSTNNEDLPGFNGAGLYASKTQHADETEEDGISKSLKQVYASLWNFRAFNERKLHNVDHMTAAMGVLVHPNHTGELANGVGVSFDPLTGGTYKYYINTQVGEDLVTNPESHSVPEEIYLYGFDRHRETYYRVLASSNRTPRGQLIMSNTQLEQLRLRMETIHDHFKIMYEPADGDPFAVEIEYKITSEGTLAIKQARPWVFPSRPTETAASGPNTQATGKPTITSTPQVGQKLTARLSAIQDAEGLYNANFRLMWFIRQNGTFRLLQNDSRKSYKVKDPDEGGVIWVTAYFNDDAGNSESMASESTAPVAPATVTNSPPTGTPTIIGTVQVGETLTADISDISDADGLTSPGHSYQWIRGNGPVDTDIEHATAATYTLVTADQGKTIKFRISFSDDAGNAEALTSEATVEVAAAPNRDATGAPTISGKPQVDQTLAADTSAIADMDGLTNVSYSHQWIRNDGEIDTDIEGATAPAYTPLVSDVGKTVKVKVSFTDDRGHEETLTSAATDAVLAAVPTGPLSLTVTRGGQIQELDVSWQAPASDGGSDVTGYKVQWKEAADSWDTAADVSEATVTGTTHTIAELTGEQEYTVRVIATNDVGDGAASSEAKGTPAGGVSEQNTESENNAPTGVLAISGTARVGETLTVDISGIADADGLTNVSYRYQWMVNYGETDTDTDIDRATGSTYEVSRDNVGKAIKVRVSFTDDADNQETLTSVATDAVAATKPGVPGHLNVSPHDTGALDVYWEAPASDGGSDVTGYRVQWKKITGSWDTAADVSEATVTGATHTITGLSDGVEYSVRVMATNGVGDSWPSAERSGIPRETRAPGMVIPRVDGATLRVLYDEALDEGSVPAANAFDVRITCQCDSKRWWHEEARRGVDGVTVDGDTVLLTLAIPADAGDGVVVSYTPPLEAVAARTRDLAGNAAAGFVPTEVFNDTEEDAGAEETGEGETALTVSLENVPESHHGTGVFTFEIRFSEEVRLSYKTLRDHAFTVTGGSVVKAQRTDKPSNIPWRITVRPESNGEVTIILPATTKCAALRAICTADGKKLSGPPGPTDPLTFTVSGPGG